MPHLGDVILKDVETLNLDAVVISGDFTLRGRYNEYQTARVFIDQIHKPFLTIPGNHDQPLYAPFERLTTPYARYSKYICETLDSSLAVDGLFVLGLSDCNPILPGGFWTSRQRAWIKEQLAGAPRDAVKVLVSHHQFLWGGKWRPAGFWYPTRALTWLARQGVEMMLNGHTHVPSAQEVAGVVVARAGTATSDRVRHGWSNSYNVVTIDDQQIAISVRQYDSSTDDFQQAHTYTFQRHVAQT